ncbi:MAG: 50S ribosomal protein L29 [Patescibacteria group bacterium]
MKMKEIKEKNLVELQKLLAASREKLRDLRFKVANKQLKDVREVRTIKQGIARVLTELNNKRQLESKTGAKSQTAEVK